jgi:uncharacterized membrane protein
MIQSISLYVMSAIYVFAGLNHFINTRFYISIMPKFFPVPNLLNQISGIAEIILGIGLLFTETRQLSAYLIIAMLVVFFAVHISHLIVPPKMANGKYWVLILRIPIQFLLIYWAYIVSKY